MAGGNYATPWRALAVLDGTVPRYRLFALNAQAGMPDRDGVTLESPFVGPGMRGSGRLRYFPCRLSLVPSGALNQAKPVTASFAFGSADLYAWMEQPGCPDAAHRDGERPGADRAPAADGLGASGWVSSRA